MKIAQLDWLCQVMIEAGFMGSLAVGILAIPRDCNQYEVSLPVGPKAFGDLVAVHVGHPDVEQHCLRPPIGNYRQRSESVVRRAHLMPDQFREHCQRACRVAVVVYDQDANQVPCLLRRSADSNLPI